MAGGGWWMIESWSEVTDEMQWQIILQFSVWHGNSDVMWGKVEILSVSYSPLTLTVSLSDQFGDQNMEICNMRDIRTVLRWEYWGQVRVWSQHVETLTHILTVSSADTTDGLRPRGGTLWPPPCWSRPQWPPQVSFPLLVHIRSHPQCFGLNDCVFPRLIILSWMVIISCLTPNTGLDLPPAQIWWYFISIRPQFVVLVTKE